MKWTNEPPTSPGIFCWRAGKGSEVKTVVLAYTKGMTAYTPELFVVYPQNDHTPVQYARDMGGQWAIPRKGNADEMDK